MKHNDTIALHLTGGPNLDELKRIADTGMDQFEIDAGQAICERVQGQYEFGWLLALLERISQVSKKKPYILTCRIPRWVDPTKETWANYIDGKPEKGLIPYPFSAGISPDTLKYAVDYQVKLMETLGNAVDVYLLDMEFNLPGWWKDTPDAFAWMLRAMAFEFHARGKKVVGPGVTIMEEDHKDNKEQRARDAFKAVMRLAGDVIDYPSLHSYPRAGQKINGEDVAEGAFPARALIQFADWTQLDLTRGDLWLSETGITKKDGEEKQLQGYKDLLSEFNWNGTNSEQPKIGKIVLYDSSSEKNGLFRSDYTPTLAMQWISDNYLR